MKKRLFPLLLVLTLLITLCTPFAQAAGRVLTVTSASGRAGETVSVQVRLTGSVYSGRFELAYDAERSSCSNGAAQTAQCASSTTNSLVCCS